MALDFSSPAKRVGLAAVATAGLLSAISTFVLLGYILYCTIPKSHKTPLQKGVNNFTRSALGLYLVALLVSDCIQGAAFAVNYRWAYLGTISEGSTTCIVQGSVSQFGDLGTAVFTLAITVHTFWLLFLQRKPSDWICYVTLAVFGTLIVVMPVVGSHVIPHAKGKGEFWGSSGAWCWIGDGYQLERFMYVYLWIFLNLIFSAVVYALIYLKFIGTIDYLPAAGTHGRLVFHGWRLVPRGPAIVRHPSGETGAPVDQSQIGHSLARIARRLVWYPVAYAIVVVPLSAIRLGGLAGWNAPFGMYVFAGFCFSSSGLANAVLFVLTRHSFIQRMTRPPGVHITTHKLTFIDIASKPGPKSYVLDELQSRLDQQGTSGHSIAIQLTEDEEEVVQKQSELAATP